MQFAKNNIDEPHTFFDVVRAAFYGVLALLGTLVALHQSPKFRHRGYWLWFSGALCWALVAPFAYMWIQSFNISFADAVLLRHPRAGSWRVAEAYGVVAGVSIGGLIGLIAFRHPRP
jgi:hypothetical protein